MSVPVVLRAAGTAARYTLLHVGADRMTLTATEQRVLHALDACRSGCVPKAELLAACGPRATTRVLDATVSRLNMAVTALGGERPIANVWGVGYALAPHVDR